MEEKEAIFKSNEIKILNYKGERCSGDHEEYTPEYYIEHVKLMEGRYKMTFPRILGVVVGDNEKPVTDIYFEGGLILFDEEVSPIWTRDANRRTLDSWLKFDKETSMFLIGRL